MLIAGDVIGAYLLVQLPTNALRVMLGVFVLVIVVYKLAGDRVAQLAYRPRGWHAPVIGAVTDLTSGTFNSGGPAFNSYLLLL